MIGCLEEIAFERGWMTADELRHGSAIQAKNSYGRYLAELLA